MRKYEVNNFIGKSFNKLKIIGSAGVTKRTDTLVECLCKCGKTHVATLFNVINGRVQSCGCISGGGKQHLQWTGYEEISGLYWGSIKHGAKIRDIPIEISIQDAWKQFEKQKRKCNLSGLDLAFSKTNAQRKSFATASLDRIDSTKGYVRNNIQWIHKEINKMKNNIDQRRFIELCKYVTKKSPTL